MNSWRKPAIPSLARGTAWLERVDPGAHRRIKGLRLVTAYGIASMLGVMPEIVVGLPDQAALPALAGGFALWGSVLEGQSTRLKSSRDLVFLVLACALGAASYAICAPLLRQAGPAGPEIVLLSGAFCVGYLRRHGVTGGGIGSQIYIGQLLGYTASLGWRDLGMVAVAAVLAMIAAVIPRVLSGPAEQAPAFAPLPAVPGRMSPELALGLQALVASILVLAVDAAIGLTESVWAITACTYVVAGSTTGTMRRALHRVVGTVIGVPLGLAFLPLIPIAPLIVWLAAALAMVIYAVALPERYDIACGAYAFTLIVTLAVFGEHSLALLSSRIWETLIGGLLGLAAAFLVFPIRPSPPLAA